MNEDSQLIQILASSLEEAVKNPIWQILHLEDPHFLFKVSGRVKLRLLELAQKSDLITLSDCLIGRDLPVNIFEIESFEYEESDSLEEAFQVDSAIISCYCYDPDADLEDLHECNSVPLSAVLTVFLDDPEQSLQSAVEKNGFEYEHCISPRNGYPMRPGGVKIETSNGFWQFEYDTFPEDFVALSKLDQEGEYYFLRSEDDYRTGERPLFSSSPSWDDNLCVDGCIHMEWKCDCYVPVEAGDSTNEKVYRKHIINKVLTFAGNSIYDDYKINYRYKAPRDIADLLADVLSSEENTASIKNILLKILGLKA